MPTQPLVNIYPTARVDFQAASNLSIRGVMNAHYRDLAQNPQFPEMDRLGGFESGHRVGRRRLDARQDLVNQLSVGMQQNPEVYNKTNTTRTTPPPEPAHRTATGSLTYLPAPFDSRHNPCSTSPTLPLKGAAHGPPAALPVNRAWTSQQRWRAECPARHRRGADVQHQRDDDAWLRAADQGNVQALCAADRTSGQIARRSHIDEDTGNAA